MSTETLQQVADTTLQKPISLTVDVHARNKVHGWLLRWGIAPKQRVFVIKPIYLGTLVRISKALLSIEFKIPDNNAQKQGALLDVNYEAIVAHSKTMAGIVAMAIVNADKEPDKKLVSFIIRNFTTKEMMAVLAHVLKQMDITSFMTSIISVRGLNVLEIVPPAPVMPASNKEMSL